LYVHMNKIKIFKNLEINNKNSSTQHADNWMLN
jgi:hypothetical protein